MTELQKLTKVALALFVLGYLQVSNAFLPKVGVQVPQRQQYTQTNMCICIDCSRVTNCQAYHFVETKHGQPHMTENPVSRDDLGGVLSATFLSQIWLSFLH